MALTSNYISTTTSATYTSSGNTAVITFYISNYNTTANATFSVWAVRNGQNPSNINVLYSNVTVQKGDTYVADTERLMLDSGDALYAYASQANVMSMTVTYTNI
jgi:hypothetical protein